MLDWNRMAEKIGDRDGALSDDVSTEAAVEKIHDAADALMYAMAWRRTDDIERYEPDLIHTEATRTLAAVREQPGAETTPLVIRLAGELLSLAAFAYWPLQMRGELEMSADEYVHEYRHAVGWDWEFTELARRDVAGAVEALQTEMRRLEPAVERLASSKIERCAVRRMHDVAEPASELAQRAAVFAVVLDHGEAGQIP